MSEKITIKCLELKQPIGRFYIGVIGHSDLSFISKTDVRRLENKDRDVETYIGIQRPLNNSRVKEISKYVELVDATFPTGVILSVSSDNVDYNGSTNELIIKKEENVASVLDGQHRIAGLEGCSLDNNDFQINVVIFVDIDIEDQAIIFATINKTQTKVQNSLVADLFEFSKNRSPQKTAHNIARALDQKEGSPFYKKIKILGSADGEKKKTITQATFVNALQLYITNDAMSDRDLYKRNKKPKKVFGKDEEKLIFRNLFIDNEEDKIAQIILNYFNAVYERWPIAWGEVRDDMILNKSTGFIALMRFLKDIYNYFSKPGTIVSKEDFCSILNKVDLSDDDFNKNRYIPGGVGQSNLYKDLKSFL